MNPTPISIFRTGISSPWRSRRCGDARHGRASRFRVRNLHSPGSVCPLFCGPNGDLAPEVPCLRALKTASGEGSRAKKSSGPHRPAAPEAQAANLGIHPMAPGAACALIAFGLAIALRHARTELDGARRGEALSQAAQVRAGKSAMPNGQPPLTGQTRPHRVARNRRVAARKASADQARRPLRTSSSEPSCGPMPSKRAFARATSGALYEKEKSARPAFNDRMIALLQSAPSPQLDLKPAQAPTPPPGSSGKTTPASPSPVTFPLFRPTARSSCGSTKKAPANRSMSARSRSTAPAAASSLSRPARHSTRWREPFSPPNPAPPSQRIPAEKSCGSDPDPAPETFLSFAPQTPYPKPRPLTPPRRFSDFSRSQRDPGCPRPRYVHQGDLRVIDFQERG